MGQLGVLLGPTNRLCLWRRKVAAAVNSFRSACTRRWFARQAEGILKDLEGRSRRAYVPPYQFAIVYASAARPHIRMACEEFIIGICILSLLLLIQTWTIYAQIHAFTTC
jgi:hypothetical protein